MTDYQVNINTWFMEREVKNFPRHFIVTRTPITQESKQWILETLQGRFCIVSSLEIEDSMMLGFPTEIPAFEDPQEATFYELKWS